MPETRPVNTGMSRQWYEELSRQNPIESSPRPVTVATTTVTERTLTGRTASAWSQETPRTLDEALSAARRFNSNALRVPSRDWTDGPFNNPDDEFNDPDDEEEETEEAMPEQQIADEWNEADFIRYVTTTTPKTKLGLTVNPVFTDKKGFQKSAAEGVVGIEVEQESLNSFAVPSVRGWQVHNEGSLRGFGFEYVLSPPLPFKEAVFRTTNLFKALDAKEDYKPTNSIRTSIHVHFDVTKYTFNQLLLFAGVYWSLEEYLSNFAGESRKGNLFCIRLKDSLYFSKILSRVIKDPSRLVSELSHESLRYSSVNFAALNKFGSLEFRLMRGTSIAEEVDLWVTALEEIRQYALGFNNLQEFVHHFYSKIPAEDFARTVFSDAVFNALQKYVPSGISCADSIRSIVCELKCLCSTIPSFDFEKETQTSIEKLKKEYTNALKSNKAARYLQNIRRDVFGYVPARRVQPDNAEEDETNLTTVLTGSVEDL